jgi:hypothetical protein
MLNDLRRNWLKLGQSRVAVISTLGEPDYNTKDANYNIKDARCFNYFLGACNGTASDSLIVCFDDTNSVVFLKANQFREGHGEIPSGHEWQRHAPSVRSR